MGYGLSLITAPTAEPISVVEARLHCRVDFTDEDSLLSNLITAARKTFEARTNRQLVTATWQLNRPDFPAGSLLLPKAPLQSVSFVKYYDGDGTLQTWGSSNYVVSSTYEPGRITPVYGASWPVAREQEDAVQVRFVCGYGAPSAVPADVKAALLLLVGHWYANREEVIVGSITASLPMAAESLMSQCCYGDEFAEYGGVPC